MNLVPAIRQMETEIHNIERRHFRELKELKDGLNVLRKLNTVCEKCNGNKQIMRPRSCAEDDMIKEKIMCPECRGSGLNKNGERENAL